MATLFLNEGTEIEVKETAAEILELTKHKKNEEKETGASDNLIKLTRIKYIYVPPKSFWASIFWDYGTTQKKEITIFLYMKRVLFFYD